MPKTARPKAPAAPKSQTRLENRAVLETLRSTREAADLLQTELADALGRSQSYVSSAERGLIRLDAVQLADWCRACGTTFTAMATAMDRLWASDNA